MARTMVLNESTCMATGDPRHSCTCSGHARERRLLNGAAPNEVSEVELARLLGVESDPGTQPVQFLAELRARIDELRARFSEDGLATPVVNADDAAADAEDIALMDASTFGCQFVGNDGHAAYVRNIAVLPGTSDDDREDIALMDAAEHWNAAIRNEASVNRRQSEGSVASFDPDVEAMTRYE